MASDRVGDTIKMDQLLATREERIGDAARDLRWGRLSNRRETRLDPDQTRWATLLVLQRRFERLEPHHRPREPEMQGGLTETAEPSVVMSSLQWT